MSSPFNVLSLFSGIGGLDLGLERAGMTVVGQVEIDPWCRKVLAKHWPEVPRHDDVRTAAEWWGRRPAPDLVAGGFPCQPVSAAGKRLAQADSRWLWPAFADVIRHLRPAFVFVENVPGLLACGMGDVLGDLAALGYDAEWDRIPAAYFGTPHLRNRVGIVAYPGGAGRGLGTGRRDQQQEGGEGPRHVAHPVSAGLAQREGQPGDDGAELAAAQRGRHNRGDDREDVADTTGLGRGHRPRIFRGVGTAGCSRWAPEPDVGRVAHGVPSRVDRLRGLGNAVVPQWAEHIGRLILADAA